MTAENEAPGSRIVGLVEDDGSETLVDLTELEHQADTIIAKLLYRNHTPGQEPWSDLTMLRVRTGSTAYTRLVVRTVLERFGELAFLSDAPLPMPWAFTNLHRLGIAYRGIRFRDELGDDG